MLDKFSPLMLNRYKNVSNSALDNILQMNGRELLTHVGKINHQMAVEKSNQELEKYNEEQKRITHEQSLKEIEEDIKKLKNDTNT